MTIGERIRQARESAGMTLDELASRCGTIRQTMFKYEHGIVTNIPLSRIEKISDALGVTSAWLLDWHDADFPDARPVSDLIARRRKELGLSRKDVATFVGVSESTVSRWESGDIEQMKRSRIERLAECLQISPLVLLGYGEKEAAPAEAALSDVQIKLIEAVKHMSEEKAESLCLLLGL